MNKSALGRHWMKVRGQHHARPFDPEEQRPPRMHCGGAGQTPVLCTCLSSEPGHHSTAVHLPFIRTWSSLPCCAPAFHQNLVVTPVLCTCLSSEPGHHSRAVHLPFIRTWSSLQCCAPAFHQSLVIQIALIISVRNEKKR